MAIFSSYVSLPEGIYHKSMDYGSIYDIMDDYGYQYDIFHDNEQHWMIMDEFMIHFWSQEMLQEGFQPLVTWFLFTCSVIVLDCQKRLSHQSTDVGR